MSASRLPAYEWLIIILFCTFLLALATLAWMKPSARRDALSHSNLEQAFTTLHVSIDGAVSTPGVYQLPPNSTVKDLCDRAVLLPHADLSRLKERNKLKQGQHLNVPFRVWITIQIEGAVKKPGQYKILSGTRIQECVKELDLLPKADLKSLSKSKRYLSEYEVINIPFKKSKEGELR